MKKTKSLKKIVLKITMSMTQAMAKAFQERGDRHSGSLERHRADLNTVRRNIDHLQVNQSTIVDECSVLQTQVESMGDNLCRSGLRKKLLGSFLLISSLDVGNTVANAIGKMAWGMLMTGPRDPITPPS